MEDEDDTPPVAYLYNKDEYETTVALLDLYGPIQIPNISRHYDYLSCLESPNRIIDYDRDA